MRGRLERVYFFSGTLHRVSRKTLTSQPKGMKMYYIFANKHLYNEMFMLCFPDKNFLLGDHGKHE